MATAAALFNNIRRSRQLTSLSLLSVPRVLTSQRHVPSHPPPPPLSTHPSLSRAPPFAFLGTRAFSTHFPGDSQRDADSLRVESEVDSELLRAIGDAASTGGGGEDDRIFPVRTLISMLDAYHDVSGFPWWIIIVSSTLALRIVLLFPLVLTLHKVKRIAEFFPKLPPPIPPPFSGKSYRRQFQFFQKKRKEVGCPSYVWPLLPIITQLPCFFLWMISIRKMSLDGHPGFSCGGALWFQNLTELSHDYSGFIFPILIASLHYINVQISFRKPVVEEARDIFDLLAKYYKWYLDFLTLPIAFIGFCIPQGSQLYWATNSSLTLIQHYALRHPVVLAKLGLQDNKSQKAAIEEGGDSKATKEFLSPGNNPIDSPEKWHKFPIEEMSPEALVALAIPFMNSNDKESAIPLLKHALDKDPQYVRALVLMGRILLLKQSNDEANEYFERAISKLYHAGLPTDAEDLDLLILSSQWAGTACERQGKKAEGRVHFERIANMEEPRDPTSKRYYFDGLLLLASSLYDEGNKEEAAKYLRLVVAYNPSYQKFLDQCERNDDDDDGDDDDIVTDLANSRREL
ncbi:hypothetical protein HN51_005927 [Arachis hypogaea]|nr:ALBINO3-like protein 2, chloroplastic isoform X1 [Arachis hypogaea]QHO39755.1 ALBINO3-like protein 3 [Arachis hypogaea]